MKLQQVQETLMRRAFPIAAAGIGVALAAVFLSTGATGSQNELTADVVLERFESDQVAIIDVRTGHEFSAGHIAGAINVPYDQVSHRLDEIAQHASNRDIVLYCRSGRRARVAEGSLNRRGVRNIWHLRGQYSGWRAAGYPVRRGR
jgi:phage shock protein E